MSRPHALVTGGARRVGRAIALALADAGCDVTITYASSVEAAEATARDVGARGVRGRAMRLALEHLEGVDDRARAWCTEFDRLDVLVHNASVYAPSPLGEVTPARVAHDAAINALAPLLLTSRLAALLARSPLPGGGAVVAMCDIHALGRPRREFSSYAMSKAALAEMVRSLARDLAPRVRVNGVAPGVVAWPASGYEADEASQKAYLSRVPLGRAGTPDDAARAVKWLALDAAYVTGEIIRVDGGRWLA